MGRWVNIMTTVSSDGSLGLVSTIGMVELSSLLSGGWSDFGQVIFLTQMMVRLRTGDIFNTNYREREREREREEKKKKEREIHYQEPLE